MKEKDLLDEKFNASVCGFIATVVSILAIGLQAAGHNLWSGIGFSAVAVLLAFALNSLKYVLLDSKIVELKRELENALGNKASDLQFTCLREKIRGDYKYHVSWKRDLNSRITSLESLQAQFDAVNEHYGIEIEKVEAGYRVK
jgi:hypothetical protein